MNIYMKFESLNLQSKNLVHKSVDKCPKCYRTYLRASLIFKNVSGGYTPDHR